MHTKGGLPYPQDESKKLHNHPKSGQSNF